MLYPNIFRDVPESLAQAQQFMSEVAVGDVMRPLGGALMVCALIACAAAVRYRLARGWVVASMISLISGQFLLSILYLWPRATILFDERSRHSLVEIESAATEFQVGEWGWLLARTASISTCCAAAVVRRSRSLTYPQRPKATRSFGSTGDEPGLPTHDYPSSGRHIQLVCTVGTVSRGAGFVSSDRS